MSEKPCLNKYGGRRKRKIHDLNLRLPQAHTCTHTYVFITHELRNNASKGMGKITLGIESYAKLSNIAM